MPINHGIYRKLSAASDQRPTAAEMPACRYGIRRIFAALSTDQFSPTLEDRERVTNLERHFYMVFGRFVFSMQDLNRLMHELGDSYSNGMPPTATMRIMYQSECLADHALSYLNTIVDDVALMMVQATAFDGVSVDSMNKLRNKRNARGLAPVKTLLDELENPGSWWELGFKLRQGVRQQLVHNQHLVHFQVSKPPDMPYKGQALLVAPGNIGSAIDFFEVLRDILSSLFDWFDRLELALTNHLCTKSTNWSPTLICPFLPLPVGYPLGVTQYVPDYFPIPLCVGSDPLPWTISVELAFPS